MSAKPLKFLNSSIVRSNVDLLMTSMRSARATVFGFAVVLLLAFLCLETAANAKVQDPAGEFGPVVRAYLGYLRNEQEVVDDRVSRREVNQAYYRRNSNRIRALREMAMRLARQTHNDYLPELEAVARDEFGLLFHRPPRAESLMDGEVLQNTFRFLGAVRSGEIFYIFARLDPYEQAELMERASQKPAKSDLRLAKPDPQTPPGAQIEKVVSRPRRTMP
jgi:hypothetical protein